MKQTVFGILSTMIFLLLLACTMTISGRCVRQNELDQALNRAVDQALGELEGKTLSEKELAASLAQGVMTGIKSDGSVELNVEECDGEKGILSVQAVMHYEHINGKSGSVSAKRTVVRERSLQR